MIPAGMKRVEAAADWLAYVEALPGMCRSDLSWVECFAELAPRSATFWAQAAQGLHADGRHRDAYEAWQRAIKFEGRGDSFDRVDMAWAMFRRVNDEKDFDHYFADKALALFGGAGVWQMVAYIQCKRGLVRPMFEALARAYQHGEPWSQDDLSAPFDLDSWDEVSIAFSGTCRAPSPVRQRLLARARVARCSSSDTGTLGGNRSVNAAQGNWVEGQQQGEAASGRHGRRLTFAPTRRRVAHSASHPLTQRRSSGRLQAYRASI